jgi:hypothetical protein
MNGKALYDKTEGDAEYVAFAVIPAQAGIHLDLFQWNQGQNGPRRMPG